MSSAFVITAGAVTTEQQRTLSSAQVTNAGVASCAAMDPTTRSAWNAFYQGLVAWCSTPIVNFPWEGPSNAIVVTANTGDTMLAWESALQAWQQRIAGICGATVPSLSQKLPNFDPNPGLGDQATQWLKWGAVIVGFAATAYIVGSLARFVPTPSRQPKTAPSPRRQPPSTS